MNRMLFTFTPNIVKDIYLKDPLTSDLGNDIIRKSTEMIAELGFEAFTFKKLAAEIQTTEASVYRYFENKYKLLLYLTSYYWSWVEYQMVLKNSNVEDATIQLQNTIEILAAPKESNDGLLNHLFLQRIIINESSKAYLIKSVDKFNQHGMYYNYKRIVARISDIIRTINPDFTASHMLVSTIIEGIHHQKFFAMHLPSLTDTSQNENFLSEFYLRLALSTIKKEA